MLRVRVYPDTAPRHSSKIYAGLGDLESQGKIKLRYMYRRPSSITNNNEFNLHTLWLEVDDLGSGKTYKACFDMEDSSKINSLYRLRACDIYFKRNYYQAEIDGLDPDGKKKIFAYGLYYPCRSHNEKGAIQRLLIYYLARNYFFRQPLKSIGDLFVRTCKVILTHCFRTSLSNNMPLARDYEAHYSDDTEAKILFQTRVWSPDQASKDDPGQLQSLNDERASTVRALKKYFGDQFVGGLQPTPYARKHYPDCLSTESFDKRIYMANVKKCLITITTTGLHHSIGAKLPEYLAAARCIVTEPVRNRLPVPLEEGINYISFRNPDECVRACKRLLEDPSFANQMRYNNYNYYWNEVEPSVHMGKCLKLIVGSTTGESQL